MKSLRQFGVVLLLLVSLVAPAIACATPGAQMTTEERACCRMMSQCGQMEMPTSQDCCKKELSGDHESALKTDTASFHPVAVVAIWAASFEVFAPQGVGDGWVQRPEDSPPKSPPTAITILRI